MNELEQLKARAREAIARHKNAVAGLYIEGVPKYDEQRTAEMRRQYDSRRNSVLRDIEHRAREIYQEASAAAEFAGEFAPDSVLSVSERSAASERLSLVEADVASMTDTQLARRLEGVLTNGSRVEQFCYFQAARKRSAEDKRRRAQADRERGVFQGSRRISVSPLEDVLYRLEGHLVDPERTRRSEEVASRLKGAEDVMEICYLGRHNAKSVGEAYAKQNWYTPPGGWPGQRGVGISTGGHGPAANPIPSE